MPSQIISISGMTSAEREPVVVEAAERLRSGGVVVLPTESVYGAAFALTGPGFDAIDAGLTGDASPTGSSPRYTWHATSPARVLEVLAPGPKVHRRLMSVLLARPVRFEVDLGAEAASKALRTIGVEPGRIDAEGVIAVRCPTPLITRSVFDEAGVPVAMVRLSTAGIVPEGDPGRDLGALREDANGSVLSPAMVIDDGPTVFGEPSTTVRLRAGGGFEVSRSGAVPEADVLESLTRRVVFVCTGNTCRSPMAEVIARKVLDEQPPTGLETVISSAGVAAGPGAGATPEAIEAVGAQGLDLSSHRSRSLGVEDIDRADLVLTMTDAHAEMATTLRPNAAHKIVRLDPDDDIPDPIGGPLSMYQDTAARIEAAIRRRLEEIEA